MDIRPAAARNRAMEVSMKKRIRFGSLLIALVAGLLLVDWQLEARGILAVRALPLAVILMPVMAAGFVELAGLVSAAGVEILRTSGSLGGVVLAGLPFWWQYVGRPFDGYAALAVLGVIQLPIFLEQIVRFGAADAMRRVGMTLLAVVYLGAGLAVMLAIRMKLGVAALALFLAVVKCADIVAYFVGSSLGRHKLIPWLSPGKSWEGLAGALAAGAIVSVLSVLAMRFDMAAGRAAILGLAIAAAGQAGDLCESLLKRSAGIKNSGALVPEFGGALDILDSLLLAAPVAYLMLI
jgi:phosphatidate cytidylyltransferase